MFNHCKMHVVDRGSVKGYGQYLLTNKLK